MSARMKTSTPEPWPPPVWLWILLGLAMGLPGLLAIPAFGDETIYLRWAQLIARAPWTHGLISWCDPKPPAHFWLLALMRLLPGDPLWSARFSSLLAGLALLGALPVFFHLLATLHPDSPQPRRLAASLSSLLVLSCPYLLFYQRLALADAWVVTLSLGMALLSLRLAQNGASSRHTLALGALIALSLLTRQIVPWLWLALVPLAWWLLPRRRPLGSFLISAAGALALGLALWIPILLARWDGTLGQLRTRILYQSNFSRPMSLLERLGQLSHNFQLLCWPRFTASGDPTGGWYWHYLTPPVFIASLAALGYLLWQKPLRRAGLFLLAWLLLATLPLILLANVLYSRYAMPGVLPLLLALSLVISHLITNLPSRLKFIPIAGLLAMLLTPVLQIARQRHDPREGLWTREDRHWFLSTWTAGKASGQAIQFLRRTADSVPISLITTQAWGHPADDAWVYLENHPQVELFYTQGTQRLDTPTLLLGREKWLGKPMEKVTPDRLRLLLCPDPVYSGNDEIPSDRWVKNLCPGAKALARFANNPIAGQSGDQVVIYQLSQP